MIITLGEVRFAAGDVARLQPALAAYVAQVRSEPGCISYAYATDFIEPDCIRVTEVWADEAAMDEHLTKRGPLMDVLAGATITGMSVVAHTSERLKDVMGG